MEANEIKIKQEDYINVRLTHDDCVRLVRGTSPSYEMMEEVQKLKLGYYTGGFHDRWDWNSVNSEGWKALTTIQLYSLYLLLTKKVCIDGNK